MKKRHSKTSIFTLHRVISLPQILFTILAILGLIVLLVKIKENQDTRSRAASQISFSCLPNSRECSDAGGKTTNILTCGSSCRNKRKWVCCRTERVIATPTPTKKPIPTPTKSPTPTPLPSISSLGAKLTLDTAEFSFFYRGTAQNAAVDISVQPTMTSGTYMSFANGKALNNNVVVLKNPLPWEWDAYRCGSALYWRIKTANGAISPIQTATVTCPVFSQLKASLQPDLAKFNFTYSGHNSATKYKIHVSTESNFSDPIYLTFAVGSAPPLATTNPDTKWSSMYTCGRRLYWKVEVSDKNHLDKPSLFSQVGSGVVSCYEFSKIYGKFDIFSTVINYAYDGHRSGSTHYRILMSNTSNMNSIFDYLGFQTNGLNITRENTGQSWDQYRCGKNIYWQIVANDLYKSPVQQTIVTCNKYTNLSSSLTSTKAEFSFTVPYPQNTSLIYGIDLSLRPDMSGDTYQNFAQGSTGNLITTNPTKWSSYTCGQTFYWRIRTSDGMLISDIQSAQVTCD